jgi:DNA polymerase-3 subunit delta
MSPLPKGTKMIITLTGTNSFLLKSELDRRVAEFVKKHTDMGLERLDCEEAEYSRIVEAVQNLPFLADKKLIVLRSPGANKEFSEKFEELLETIPETNDVIIYEPKLDKRTAYAKALQKNTDFKSFDELGERELPNWLVAEAKNRGGELSFSDAMYLVSRVGANQQMLSNELDKLLLYELKVNRSTIDLLTDQTPQSTIFQLLDAAFAGNIKRAMELYDGQRAQRIEPQAIVPMLAWQLQAVALVKAAGKRSVDEIAREAKMSPFVLRKSATIASKLTMARLKELVHDLRELDVKLKTTSIDADEALKFYLISLRD